MKLSEIPENQVLPNCRGLNLLHVSFALKKRTAAPAFMCREVGEYKGRFYLINFSENSVERITLGAFVHLSRAWKAMKRWADSFDFATDCKGE